MSGSEDGAQGTTTSGGPADAAPSGPAPSGAPVAVVTGGSSGIGLAVSEDLLKQGYFVISLALEACPLKHAHLESHMLDLSDMASCRRVADTLARRFSVTTLVHCAGAIRPALLAEVDSEDFELLARLHWGCALILAQAFLPMMKQSRRGRIVFISSRAALGLQTRSAYSATKAGMLGLARTWALELAPEGITVNVVAPGPIRGTRVFHEVVPVGSEREAALAKSIPVQRLGEPEDVARAVAFFVHPDNSFVTGQTLYVCGGASVGSLSI
jgi:3-oxoacyl-[acyl-carrier protein] reductase